MHVTKMDREINVRSPADLEEDRRLTNCTEPLQFSHSRLVSPPLPNVYTLLHNSGGNPSELYSAGRLPIFSAMRIGWYGGNFRMRTNIVHCVTTEESIGTWRNYLPHTSHKEHPAAVATVPTLYFAVSGLEQGAEENVWTEEGWRDRRLEKTA
jgi:hypothetical protein